jgi:hypothetical protein
MQGFCMQNSSGSVRHLKKYTLDILTTLSYGVIDTTPFTMLPFL